MVIFILALLLCSLLLASCSQVEKPVTLRIGVLPILDSLPLYVAEEKGLYQANNVIVELIPVASAAERDQLLQAGQVDGVITDLVALALYNRIGTDVIAVRYAMVPTPGHPQFRILASANSDISQPMQLKGVQIGVSEGTIIEYITYRLLERESINVEQIELLPVPKIPDRMALLNAGELKAVTLPEPLASLVMQQGAVVIMDDTQHPDLSCSIVAFRSEVVTSHQAEIKQFLLAVSSASQEINNHKDQWQSLLVDQELIPPPLGDSYELPDYPDNKVPSLSQYLDVIEWLRETQRIDNPPDYADVVNSRLLP